MTVATLRRMVLAVLGALLVSATVLAQTPRPQPAPTGPTLAPVDNSIEALQKRANAGDAAAQFNLALMHDNGRGVPQDFGEAAAWYHKAAEQGHAAAQYNLGVSYGMGQGVPQDDDQAVVWFRKAAEQGHAFAQNNLAEMYYNGQGVPQDVVQEYKWRDLAAAHTSTANQEQYADLRDATAERMTPQQLTDAQDLSREWQAAFDQRTK